MSIKNVAIAVLFFVGSIMLAYMIQLQFNGDPFDRALQAKRVPGSVGSVHLHSIKEQTLAPTESVHRHTDKMRGPVTLALESSIDEAIQAGQNFRLRLKIETAEDVDTLNVKWSIPDGIDLIYGNLDGQIHNLVSGEAYFVELDLRARSSENLQIHALVSTQAGDDMRFAEVAQYNTVLDATQRGNKGQQLEAEDSETSTPAFKVFE